MANLKSKPLQLLCPKPGSQRKRRSEESSHQKAFFQWLTLWDKNVRALTFHIPNGGSRHAFEARSLKAQGVTAGVPDIFCAIPTKDFSGLWIELKSTKGALTEKQKIMGNLLRRSGYQCYVAYSWFEARDMLIHYLGCGIPDDRRLST